MPIHVEYLPRLSALLRRAVIELGRDDMSIAAGTAAGIEKPPFYFFRRTAPAGRLPDQAFFSPR